MRMYKAGIVLTGILLAVGGIGFGIAQAGEADLRVEALDSFYVAQPENGMAMEGSIETGSLSSTGNPEIPSIEVGGVVYRGEIDIGP